VVERLSRRYRLGVIANHPPQCRGVLEDLGLLGRCEVVLLAEEQGRYKPDPALFLRALERAEARGAECVMVGDRLDHDIAPAAALGMATAWIRWPDRTAKGWRPDDPEGLAYLESLQGAADRGGERVLGAPSPLSRQGRGPGEASAVQPTMIVDTLADLAAAIERLGEPLS
jgi:FMN phosphatase YigB (HAD superfamily)